MKTHCTCIHFEANCFTGSCKYCNYPPKTLKENRGGKRENAGRPKGIETTTIRIPTVLKPIIERYIKIKMLKF